MVLDPLCPIQEVLSCERPVYVAHVTPNRALPLPPQLSAALPFVSPFNSSIHLNQAAACCSQSGLYGEQMNGLWVLIRIQQNTDEVNHH